MLGKRHFLDFRVMKKQSAGFTLIELITVITLVAILSVYAVSKFSSQDSVKLRAQAELFSSNIRFIQTLAMNWGQVLRLNVSANQFSVSCVTTTTVAPCNSNPVISPNTAQAFTINLPQGINFANVSASNAVTDFDVLGRPTASGNLITGSPARSFTLSNGTTSIVIQLSPLTGFVQ